MDIDKAQEDDDDDVDRTSMAIGDAIDKMTSYPRSRTLNILTLPLGWSLSPRTPERVLSVRTVPFAQSLERSDQYLG